jgi:hypothetical protein
MKPLHQRKRNTEDVLLAENLAKWSICSSETLSTSIFQLNNWIIIVFHSILFTTVTTTSATTTTETIVSTSSATSSTTTSSTTSSASTSTGKNYIVHHT